MGGDQLNGADVAARPFWTNEQRAELVAARDCLRNRIAELDAELSQFKSLLERRDMLRATIKALEKVVALDKW